MQAKGRVLPRLLGALTVLAIGIAGVSVAFMVQERHQRMAKERELSIVKAEKEGLEQQLRDTRQAKQQAETELAKSKEHLTQLSQQIVEEQRAKAALAKSVDERQAEIDRLAKDLQQLRSERDELTRQTAQLKGQQEKLQAKLTQLDRARGDLETKVLELSGQPTVELEPVVVSSQDEAAPSASSLQTSSSQGQVIVVNREYDFIVMNLGKKQGLQIGQEFQVVRGEEVLGRVRVEKVYDDLSAATILPESKKDVIQEGDLVKAI